MITNIRFIEPAQAELDAAVEYYNFESPGLGDQFLVEVLKAIDRISQFPEAWHPFTKNTRRCQTRRFPYGIIYQIIENEILVVSVANMHRKQDYWTDRL
ncbi:type II toxin-antitoxin system RelE/ParE family toxin [Desulfobacterales bacterium HSG17]|nr:type II toxin-antitoxin system RelE/ParE family toxin [Desulfobacterales bacterium HSG17]